MLLASIEGTADYGAIYTFPVYADVRSIQDDPAINIELMTNLWLDEQLGYNATYTLFAANSSIPEFTEFGVSGCRDLLIGIGGTTITGYPHPLVVTGRSLYPYAGYTLRHCNGSYDPITILPPNPVDLVSPTLVSTRVIVPSQVVGHVPGSAFAGGYISDTTPQVNNTDWLYSGVP
jgi:hypothetical protein